MTAHSGREMAANIRKVLRAGRAGLPRDLDRVGLRIVNDLRLELSKPGTGAIYTTYFFTDRAGIVHPIGTRTTPHQASAPGEPPAVDTGQLRASYTHDAQRAPDGAVLSVGSGSPYAAYLEFGTSRMQARPHLRPVVARNTPNVRSELIDGISGRESTMARRLGGRG